ncbi:hypothetical protein SAT01_07660 [Sinomonas atrocyanea]|nr:hypothetical protein SAT01_07660 [Sinomonas atrocyanea]GGG53266.1 hypothetical protein GCM10007172_00510 [Sinomonas atrocyanea]
MTPPGPTTDPSLRALTGIRQEGHARAGPLRMTMPSSGRLGSLAEHWPVLMDVELRAPASRPSSREVIASHWPEISRERPPHGMASGVAGPMGRIGEPKSVIV